MDMFSGRHGKIHRMETGEAVSKGRRIQDEKKEKRIASLSLAFKSPSAPSHLDAFMASTKAHNDRYKTPNVHSGIDNNGARAFTRIIFFGSKEKQTPREHSHILLVNYYSPKNYAKKCRKAPGDPASLPLDQWEGHQQGLFLRFLVSVVLRRLSGLSILEKETLTRGGGIAI